MDVGPTRLSWTANTEPDLAGYKIYMGRASGVYDAAGSPIDVGNVTTYIVTINETGPWFFAITAYDTSDNESGFSSEIQGDFVIPFPRQQAKRGIFRMAHR